MKTTQLLTGLPRFCMLSIVDAKPWRLWVSQKVYGTLASFV